VRNQTGSETEALAKLQNRASAGVKRIGGHLHGKVFPFPRVKNTAPPAACLKEGNRKGSALFKPECRGKSGNTASDDR